MQVGVLAQQGLLQAVRIQGRDRGVADDQRTTGAGQARIGQRIVEKRGPNGDRVAAVLQFNGNGLGNHAPEFSGSSPASSSCLMIMPTRVATEGRPVSMTKCAVSR